VRVNGHSTRFLHSVTIVEGELQEGPCWADVRYTLGVVGRAWVLCGLLAAATGAGCSSSQTFACTEDSSCPEGWCEPSGFCSFPNAECESGRRFGEFSGPLSSQCVPVEGSTSGAEGTAGSGPTTSLGTQGSGETGDSGGTDTQQDTTGGPETSGDTTTGTDGCAGASSCYDAAPAGWSGPGLMLAGDGAACAPLDGFLEAFSGAESYGGNWGCACTCSAELEACPNTATMSMFVGGDCNGDAMWTETAGPSCQGLGYVDAYSVIADVDLPLSCETETVPNLDAVVPDGQQVVCESEAAPACAAGTCLPGGPEATACIWSGEETECPEGSYSERRVLYRGYDDGRECSECSCSAEGECEGSLYVATGVEGCNSSTVQEVSLGECSEDAFVVRGAYVDVDSEAEVDSCDTQGGAPTGGLTPLEPVTVCCLP